MTPNLPGPLRQTPSFPFAGRSRELEMLRTLVPRADGDGLRFALIGGEAGSGKTRLVREFVSEAATDHVPRTGDDVDEDGITLQIEFASGLL